MINNNKQEHKTNNFIAIRGYIGKIYGWVWIIQDFSKQ